MTFARLVRDRRVWIGLGVFGLLVALRATGLADHLSLATLATHREALVAFVSLVAFAGCFVDVRARLRSRILFRARR